MALLICMIGLSAATPAWAQPSPQVPLWSEQAGRSADGFPPNCQEPGNGPFVGLDVWTFRLPTPEQGEFKGLTLYFMTPEGQELAPVIVPGPDGDITQGTPQARVRVQAGLQIINGSAEVTGNPIGDFTVSQTCLAIPLTPDINLAWNKPAIADSQCALSQGPEKAINGSWTGGPSDRWCSTGASKWLRVDLGSSTNIRQFVLRHAGAGGEPTSFNTRAFNIQMSADSTTWTTAVTVTANTASVTTHDVTATARYVRLNITTPTQTTDPSARIYELEVYGGVNLALNKPTTADSQCALSQGPEKAVNGSSTGGLSDKWCSTGASRWLRVDFGSSATIRRVVVRHAGAGGEPTSFNTRAFNIQMSADSTTWTTAVTVTANTASVTTHDVTATARYVRLNITTPTQTTDPSARIYELEVYGQAGSLPPEVNLALNKPAIADSQCALTQGPQKAVNGSSTGGASDKWCSTGVGKWLRVDLGSPGGSLVNIRKFVLRHAGAGGEATSFNTRAFNIQMSADAIQWWTVVTVTANTANVSTHYVDAFGRYVRLNVTAPAQTTDPSARIYELEAYPPS
ncbi:discoidin domain-containing protein [Micromonospora cremea]|uniref:discoidin domain-containing protein n=1 Tax=Micromonospora cremea TaxID=709881 RepID=UPI001FCC1488|nr:discoidin domain-containing protein [Micromonospora cremea]